MRRTFRREDRIEGDVLLEDLPGIGQAGDVWASDAISNPIGHRGGSGWRDPVTLRPRGVGSAEGTVWPAEASWTPGRMATTEELAAAYDHAVATHTVWAGVLHVPRNHVRAGDVVIDENGRPVMVIDPRVDGPVEVMRGDGRRDALTLSEDIVEVRGRRWTALSLTEQARAAGQDPKMTTDDGALVVGSWVAVKGPDVGSVGLVSEVTAGAVDGHPQLVVGTGDGPMEVSVKDVEDLEIIAWPPGHGEVWPDLRSMALDPSSLGTDAPVVMSGSTHQVDDVQMRVRDLRAGDVLLLDVPNREAVEAAALKAGFVPSVDHPGRWELGEAGGPIGGLRAGQRFMESSREIHNVSVTVLGETDRAVPAGLVMAGQHISLPADGQWAPMGHGDPLPAGELRGLVQRTGPGFVDLDLDVAGQHATQPHDAEYRRPVTLWVSPTSMVTVHGNRPAVVPEVVQLHSTVPAHEARDASMDGRGFGVATVHAMDTRQDRSTERITVGQLREGDLAWLWDHEPNAKRVLAVHLEGIRATVIREEAEPGLVDVRVLDSQAAVRAVSFQERPDGALGPATQVLGEHLRSGDRVQGLGGRISEVVDLARGQNQVRAALSDGDGLVAATFQALRPVEIRRPLPAEPTRGVPGGAHPIPVRDVVAGDILVAPDGRRGVVMETEVVEGLAHLTADRLPPGRVTMAMIGDSSAAVVRQGTGAWVLRESGLGGLAAVQSNSAQQEGWARRDTQYLPETYGGPGATR